MPAISELISLILSYSLQITSRHEDEEGKGIEYPTGVGRIDILAIDEKEEEMLVIELKGGIASHDAISQVLGYMQWVEENIARARYQQSTCHKFRPKLKYKGLR